MEIIQPLTATSVLYLSLRGVYLKPFILVTQQLSGILLETWTNNRFPFLPPQRFIHFCFPAPRPPHTIYFNCSPFCFGCSQIYLSLLQLFVLIVFLISLLWLPQSHLPAACAITTPTAVSAVPFFVLPDHPTTKDLKKSGKRSL